MGFVKSLPIIVIMFLMLLLVSNAASFDITTEPIKEKIIVNEFAKYTVTVKNNLNVKDEYRIYSLDFPIWDVRTDPIVNPITLELNPGEEGSVEILVDPLKIKEIGFYEVNLNVRSKVLDSAVSVPLKVTIFSTDPLMQGYIPTVITSVGVPEKIDPRNEIPIKIVLNNQNMINYTRLEVRIESNLIKETLSTNLDPKEEKILQVITNLDPLTKPQYDNVIVSVFADERAISQVTKRIETIEYKGSQLIKEERGFLTTKSTYKFASNNEDYKGSFKVETSLLSSIFSSTSPNAKVMTENGKRYFVWDVKLDKKEMQVAITRNFVPLMIAIILFAAVVISYFLFRSPLVMIKEVNNIVKKEGGITEMNVVLHIQNRGQIRLQEIEVTDYIPGLVGIGSDAPIGSLQPTKIMRHEKKGTTMAKWTIEKLDLSEERVLSYKVRSKLSILGDFNLPVAKATFKANGKVQSSSSNRLSVSNQ